MTQQPPVPYAELHETHTGVVMLLGDQAFKVKKPVNLGFCDFTSPAERERVCRREVELNRRLSPDTYLGVAELRMPDGGGTEPVVVMRRMPADARLATRARRRGVSAEDVHAIVKALAEFHDACARGPEIDAEATAAAVSGRWTANLTELRAIPDSPLATDLVDTIEDAAARYLRGRGQVFDARISAGQIVDGHGDLLADDIFLLPDGPQFLDCLEFDDRLRYVDRLDDVAFLATDLERVGDTDLADSILGEYRALTHDDAPPSLVHHYQAYRALVRAKVACLRAAQGDESAADTARQFAELCLRHLTQGTVRIVLVGGYPGTGKSTLAAAVAADLGYEVISTDRVRKELAGLDPDTRAPAAFHDGLYAPHLIADTYAEVMNRAGLSVAAGRSVILDGTWTALSNRTKAMAVAAHTAAVVVPLRCIAPVEVAAARMVARDGPSDATPQIAEEMQRHTDPWFDAYPIDTAGELDEARKHAVDIILSRMR